jgi:aspartate oxidase
MQMRQGSVMPRKTDAAKPRSVSASQLKQLRADSIRTLQEMEDAIVRTRNQLKTMEIMMRRVRKMIESGRTAGEVAQANNAAVARAATSEIIREVQGSRHRAQQAQFKLAAAEGSTMAEIARGWGISRQLVSRMVKEPTPRRRQR